MHAIVLAAGQGTRAWPLTATRPKPALPLLDETLLGRLLRQIAEAGVTRATVVVPPEEGPVQAIARAAADIHDLDLVLQPQTEAKGTGHALLQAREAAGEGPVAVVHGDVVVEDEVLGKVLRADVDEGEGLIAAARVPDVSAFGALDVQGGRLRGLVEKGRTGEGLVNAGVMVLPPAVWDLLAGLEPSERGEVELTDAIRELARQGLLWVRELPWWNDVGWPWDLLDVTEHLLPERPGATIEGDVHETAVLKGAVTVMPGARVRSGSVIEGPALLLPGATVGPNAYVRGCTVLGRDTKVGHGCEVKNSLLFDGAKVPHVSYVGDSILGEGVNLGAGTQVANLRHDGADIRVGTQRGVIDSGRRKLGVILGDGVRTGINSTLNVGVVLPPGDGVGPGETVLRSRV